MKNNFLFLLLIILLLIGCKNNNHSEISMSIKKGTLTNTGATIIITDTTNNNNIYDVSYKIDKKENNIWKELDTITDNYGWNDIGYNVGKDKKLELNINWEWLYGKLNTGKYRIVKSIPNSNSKKYFSKEFIIK